MIIKYGLFDEKEGTVTAWHKDSVREGNYVLTIRTSFGRNIEGVEIQLTPDQIEELIETVPEDGI